MYAAKVLIKTCGAKRQYSLKDRFESFALTRLELGHHMVLKIAHLITISLTIGEIYWSSTWMSCPKKLNSFSLYHSIILDSEVSFAIVEPVA